MGRRTPLPEDPLQAYLDDVTFAALRGDERPPAMPPEAIELVQSAPIDPADVREQIDHDHAPDYFQIHDATLEWLNASGDVLVRWPFAGEFGASPLLARVIKAGRPVTARMKNRHGEITHEGMPVGLEPLRPNEEALFTVPKGVSPLRVGDELNLTCIEQ